MIQLRQFHLKLALTRPGTLGKNIEYQRGAVENLALKNLFKIAALRWAELLVENHRIHLSHGALLGKFARLTGTDERRGVDLLEPLRAATGNFSYVYSDVFMNFQKL